MGNFVNIYPSNDHMSVHVHTVSHDWNSVTGLCMMGADTVSSGEADDSGSADSGSAGSGSGDSSSADSGSSDGSSDDGTESDSDADSHSADEDFMFESIEDFIEHHRYNANGTCSIFNYVRHFEFALGDEICQCEEVRKGLPDEANMKHHCLK